MGSPLNRLRSGAVWGAVCQGGTGVLFLVNGGLLARMLEAHELGYFFAIVALCRLGAMLVAFGMQNGVLKEIGIAADHAHWSAVRRISGYVWRFLLVSVSVGAIVFTGLWPVLQKWMFDQRLTWLIGGLVFALIVFRAVELIGGAFFRAVRKQTLGLFLLGVPRELLFAAVLGVLWLTATPVRLDAVLWVYVSVTLGVTLLIGVLVQIFFHGHRAPSKNEPAPTRRQFFDLCLPVMLRDAAATFSNGAGVYALSIFRTAEEVALFGAVARLTTLIDFTLNVLNLVLPPMIAAAYARSRIRRLNLLVRTASSWSMLIAVTIVLTLVLGGEWLLGFVYGEAFREGWPILMVLAMGSGAIASLGSPILVLQMTGHHRLALSIALSFICLRLIAILTVVQPFGAIGVASAAAVVGVSQKLTTTYIVYRKTGVLTLPSLRLLSVRRFRRLLKGMRPNAIDKKAPDDGLAANGTNE